MYNPIEEKRRFVESQIQKSFNSGINVSEEIELEKAHKDGDHHPTKPWVWVSSANGGKGDWRVEGGRAHKKAGASITDAADGSKVDITKIPDAEFKRITQMLEKKNPDHTDAPRHLEEEAMSDKELKNFYAVAEHFKNSSKINKMTQEYCRKWAELARQELQYRKKAESSTKNQTSTPSPRKPGSTDEIERMTPTAVHNAIIGLNNIATNVKDRGDHFKIDFDANDFNTNGKRSPQIDRIAKFLESMGASCVIGSNSIKAYKKVDAKKNTTSKSQSLQDKVKDIMQQFDDTTMDDDEFDEYVDSVLGNDMGQKLRKEILNSNKSFSDKKQAYKDAVERHLGLKPQKYSDMDIKDAKKALVGKVVTLKDYWPDGRGGSQDAVGEIKNVRLYGKDKLPIAEISYPNGDEQLIRLDEIDDGKMKDSYKTPITIGNDATKLDAVKKKIANSKSDQRDKIAHDAGFKDYEEMKGYQDYVTQKNLLKKRSTGAGMRLLYQQEVDKYEKNHADLIKKMTKYK